VDILVHICPCEMLLDDEFCESLYRMTQYIVIPMYCSKLKCIWHDNLIFLIANEFEQSSSSMNSLNLRSQEDLKHCSNFFRIFEYVMENTSAGRSSSSRAYNSADFANFSS